MADTADLSRDDDDPPSGVRRVVLDRETPFQPAPVSMWLAPQPPLLSTRDVLGEVTEEVFVEVWRVVRAVSPLRLSWMRLGPRHLVDMARTLGTWRYTSTDSMRRSLSARWPELVPGHEAMNALAGIMVDALC